MPRASRHARKPRRHASARDAASGTPKSGFSRRAKFFSPFRLVESVLDDVADGWLRRAFDGEGFTATVSGSFAGRETATGSTDSRTSSTAGPTTTGETEPAGFESFGSAASRRRCFSPTAPGDGAGDAAGVESPPLALAASSSEVSSFAVSTSSALTYRACFSTRRASSLVSIVPTSAKPSSASSSEDVVSGCASTSALVILGNFRWNLSISGAGEVHMVVSGSDALVED